MGRKTSSLEFRRPRQRAVVAGRRRSKFRPGGLSSSVYGPQAVPPLLRYWIAITLLVAFFAWVGVTIFQSPL